MSLTNIFQDSHLHRGLPCTYYFISIFIELPSGSFCGGERCCATFGSNRVNRESFIIIKKQGREKSLYNGFWHDGENQQLLQYDF